MEHGRKINAGFGAQLKNRTSPRFVNFTSQSQQIIIVLLNVTDQSIEKIK